MRLLLPLLTMLLVLAPCHQSRADSLTVAKKAGIRHLMMLTGADRLGDSLARHLGEQMSQRLEARGEIVQGQMKAIIDFEVKQLVAERLVQLKDEMVRIYADHFSHEEIKQLIAFYRSEIGKKSLRELPAILGESREAGQTWGEEMFAELARRIDEKLAGGNNRLTK